MVNARILLAVVFGVLLGLAAPAARALPAAEAGAPAAAPPIAVVVHAGVPAAGLSLSALRTILLGNQRFWNASLRVEVLIEAGPTPARRAFVEGLSGMSEVQFQQYWIGQVFRGRATHAPRAVPDRATALALVAALPGAIALVEAGEVPPGVRVLAIDGALPGADGYPLAGSRR